MAMRLFVALHHLHILLLANDDDDDDDGGNEAVLTNGMYSHVVDALAKSPNVLHAVAADALLRQFMSLHVGRHGPTVEKGMPWHCSTLDDDRPTDAAPSSPFGDPGGLRWNDCDRHQLPNHVWITGVMREYALHSRPRDTDL